MPSRTWAPARAGLIPWHDKDGFNSPPPFPDGPKSRLHPAIRYRFCITSLPGIHPMIRQILPFRNKLMISSISIIYLWFGTLKFFPGVSPAENLAKETITILTFGLIPTSISIVLLAIWEVSVGILLIALPRKRIGFHLAMIHLVFTFAPLIILPAVSYQHYIFSPTLVGQYILKNIIIFSALLFVYPITSVPGSLQHKFSARGKQKTARSAMVEVG